MASASLKFEDKLEGASNFSPWRKRIGLLFKEQGLWEIVEGNSTSSKPNTKTNLSQDQLISREM
jgi:hypothetical protein